MRIRHFLVLVAVAGLFAACRSSPAPNGMSEKQWVGHLVAYRKAVSESHGTVGYVKTWRFENETGGEPFTLYRVYDLNFKERGVVTPMGTGKKYIDLPTEIARVKGHEREIEELPAQPLTWDVSVILDTPHDIKLVPVTPAELAAAGEPTPKKE
jgi:hypothetical protein